MPQYANAIMTKCRAIYGNMLSPAQYDELLRKQSVQEIAAFLKEKTSYAPALAGVQESTVHRGQLESLLHKDAFYHYVRLIRYAPKNEGIYNYVVMDIEIELILACLRDIISARPDDEYIASLPTFIQPYISFHVLDLVGVKNVGQVMKIIENTEFGPVFRKCMEAHPQVENQVDYTAYELALRTYYFETLLGQVCRSARGTARKELTELVTIRAELMNINMMYRLKAYFHASPDQVRAMLLPFTCRLSRRTLDELIAARDAQEFLQRLSRTIYGKVITPDTTYIEGATGNIRYRLDLKRLRFSTDPQVVFTALMLLRTMEVENIIRIIEGVRYHLPPEKIEKLLYSA
ncbi:MULTISPECIES: V0D/AC39 family V-type ATPase subunit [Anaerotruncus]|jgi:V/A-type H+-transporting ATPase subunit C|uniref:V0D/AC39 family V-type ATPase subunit n=1 Tax=Anaerotruncus TaxID=244127 RepID=UPI000830086D|nr:MULTISPECIES: V-type ATPase subunit [Anaerotruncus]RGX55667.1 hypothetical protein DWV16_07880 [Anaerotruncus sp. AF02-27]